MKRYNGIEIRIWDGDDDLREGLYYLIRTEWLRYGRTGYFLKSDPGRTNLSSKCKVLGWLGTTNDVANFAEGCVRVKKDSSGRLRITSVKPDVLAMNEETAV